MKDFAVIPGKPGISPSVFTGRISLYPGSFTYVPVYRDIDHFAQCVVEGRKP